MLPFSSGRICIVRSPGRATSSLQRLLPNEGTLWLLHNRRQVGLLFAWSQLLHLLALVALGQWYPEPFLVHLSAVNLTGGGLAYFFTFAMAATSNDRAVRWLGLPAGGDSIRLAVGGSGSFLPRRSLWQLGLCGCRLLAPRYCVCSQLPMHGNIAETPRYRSQAKRWPTPHKSGDRIIY